MKRIVTSPLIWLVLVLMLLGIVLRWVNLGEKFYWVDEVHTSTRIAGYTRSEVQARIFDQGMVAAPALRRYQVPGTERGWPDTLSALKQHPEHPPLYYLAGRLWLQGWLPFSPDWVLGLRSLAVLLSLAALPGVYWLCQELFKTSQVGWMAIALFSISPLHILYGQEARAYSLMTAITVLSSAALLRALRRDSAIAWVGYGVTLVVGLYSHLLFGLVAIAHGLYLVLDLGLTRDSAAALKRYGLTLGVSLLAFLPWLVVLIRYVAQVGRAVSATQRDADLSYLINVWLRNLSRIFFSGDLGTANLVLLALVLYSLYVLVRETPRQTWLLPLSILAVTALPLMLADSITGGISSTRIRYLIPAYVILQLAIAHLFAHVVSTHGRAHGPQAPALRTQRYWRIVVGLFLTAMVVTSVIDATQPVSWAKSDKAEYYQAIATAINAGDRPLVVSDSSPTYILALSRLMQDDVTFNLVTRPNRLDIPDGFGDIFMFDPTPRLRRVMTETLDYDLEIIVEQNNSFQLWQAHR